MRASRAIQLAFVAVLFALWWQATHGWHVSALLLPTPLAVLLRARVLISSGEVWTPLAATAIEVAGAFSLSAVIGLALGVFIARAGLRIRVAEPLLTALNAIPAILFFPLFTLVFGLGAGSKIALGATIGVFPIALNTISGLSNVERPLITAAISMGASRMALLRHVLLPAAAPSVLAGLRIGLTLSFLAVLGGETIASFDGLGHQIADAADNMEAATMYAYILVVVLVAAVLNQALARLDGFGQRR